MKKNPSNPPLIGFLWIGELPTLIRLEEQRPPLPAPARMPLPPGRKMEPWMIDMLGSNAGGSNDLDMLGTNAGGSHDVEVAETQYASPQLEQVFREQLLKVALL
ncbi:hypothetical protein C2845_PM18G06660 [Panicum miliaceum]|uniref:Uncharacterized protein n=1 Tax=Panicum miliaceum TaxID=4540 RepID=A0A3L6PGM9_PANMI|nr:hypothetical protein C2845_PM18G06660 [Panicum miliaceum]